MKQSGLNDASRLRLPEKIIAMTPIELGFQVLTLLDRRFLLRKIIQLSQALAKHKIGRRVGQPKADRLRYFARFPMRKIAA
ncbi:hypothetical protein LMIY3S_04866 [Labrys miyagiensis]